MPSSGPSPSNAGMPSSAAGQSPSSLDEALAERTRQLLHANERLRDAERLQSLVLQALPDVLIRCDRESTVLDITGPAHQMVAPPDDLKGQRWLDRPELSDSVRTLWRDALIKTLDTGRSQIVEYRHDVMAGSAREFEARMTRLGADEAIAIVRDVTERNRLRQRLVRLASHDEVTGLLNRSAFVERTRMQLKDSPQSLAIVVANIDGFRAINDRLGQAAADMVLKLVANRLMRHAGIHGLRARLYADRFVLALPAASALHLRSETQSIVERLLADLSQHMRVHNERLYLTVTAGISLYPADGAMVEALIEAAELAVQHAKDQGGNRLQFFDEIGAPARRLVEDHELRQAIEQAELSLLYQPMMRTSTGRIAAIEALVRWPRMDGQIEPPERFIAMAEENGLLPALGRWLLSQAFSDLRRLDDMGRERVRIGINVSMAQIMAPDFVADLRQMLATHQVEPTRVTLEISERTLNESPGPVEDAIADVAATGVRLSIDDFGIGHAGLSWLRRLPVSEIKLDRSFIKGCAMDAMDATIVSGVTEIAHNLGLGVVAVGVERADQIAFLGQVKCDLLQGYFLGMPMTFEELYKTQRLWPEP